MTIIFLILGIFLGALAVIFVLQNTAIVTVTFMSSQIQGSLALILFVAITTGVVITLLLLLPSFISDAWALSSARKDKRKLEEELAAHKRVIAEQPATHTPII